MSKVPHARAHKGRSGFVVTALLLFASCTRHAQTERMMTWSDEVGGTGMVVPGSGRFIVLRFVEDPRQGLILDGSSALRNQLTRLGNPVRVSFDCWRHLPGTFGFNITAIGGEPYVPRGNAGPSRERAFSEGPSRPHPLESAVPQ